jgi:hypothetical protein
MSSGIWTHAELLSNAIRLRARAWRAVEAQHRVSTAKLTDSGQEQERLEQLIENSKPSILEECRHLSFLLSTPFRYGAVYPTGSRFRRSGYTAGVFYAAELSKTTITELAFYRLLFFADSPSTPWPKNPGEYSAFAVEFDTDRGLDLTKPSLNRHASLWKHPTDYSHCQALADGARAADLQAIAYESVRAPTATNYALLTCQVFAKPDEVGRETWRIHFSSSGVRIFCEMPRVSYDLPRSVFDTDPRTQAMNWDR